MKKISLILLAVVLLSPLSAKADPVDYTFNFTSAAYTGSGTFITTATSTPGQYTITGITGMIDGSIITALFPPGGYPVSQPPANDNLLFYPSSSLTPYLDVAGVSFADAAGADFNVYYGTFFANATGYQIITGASGTTGGLLNTFTVSPAAAAPPTAVTPEPSTWILLATGLIGAFFIARRRLPASTVALHTA